MLHVPCFVFHKSSFKKYQGGGSAKKFLKINKKNKKCCKKCLWGSAKKNIQGNKKKEWPLNKDNHMAHTHIQLVM